MREEYKFLQRLLFNIKEREVFDVLVCAMKKISLSMIRYDFVTKLLWQEVTITRHVRTHRFNFGNRKILEPLTLQKSSIVCEQNKG